MANFEGKDRREATLKKVLPEYGFKNLDEARELMLMRLLKVFNLSHSITHLGLIL